MPSGRPTSNERVARTHLPQRLLRSIRFRQKLDPEMGNRQAGVVVGARYMVVGVRRLHDRDRQTEYGESQGRNAGDDAQPIQTVQIYLLRSIWNSETAVRIAPNGCGSHLPGTPLLYEAQSGSQISRVADFLAARNRYYYTSIKAGVKAQIWRTLWPFGTDTITLASIRA